MRYRAPLIVSSILHVAMLMLLRGSPPPLPENSGDGNDKEGGGNDTVDVTIIDKMPGVGPGEECPDWYGGIGVTTDWAGYVTYVGKGYPADRAGIQIGDKMLNMLGTVRGEPGTKVDVTFRREGVEFTKEFTRERICENK